MTGPEIDVSRRRRLTQLRAELGVSFVPPDVGHELHTVAPLVAQQVADRLDLPNSDLDLSPEGRRQLLTIVNYALEDFARIVQNRLSPPPTVEALLLEVVHSEGTEPCLPALDAITARVREAMSAQLPQLDRARAHADLLDTALGRYADRLRSTVARTRVPKRSARRSSAPGVEELAAKVEERWGAEPAEPAELYVSVTTPGATCMPARRDDAASIRLIVDDHVVIVSTHPAPPPPSVRSPQPPIVVTHGPVSVGQVVQVHDILLLLKRLIRAGVASPPTPVVTSLPDLGFLRPRSDPASVQAIADLLRPLTDQGPDRRVQLARTLRLRLGMPGGCSALAAQLGMHPQTVRNHLNALGDLYGHELDFDADTLAIQAALNLVLPLWELELAARQR